MALGRIVACLLVLSILPLAPLAFASPIDPSFPGGLYDGGDFDDVIDVITCSVGVLQLVPPAFVRPLHLVTGAVHDNGPPSHAITGHSPSPGRAPPLL